MAAITVPHHMSVAMFPLSLEQFHHPGYDRAAEIYSCWGDSLEDHRPVSTYAERVPELAFIHAVRAGHRVGFLASSDSHDGYPGAAQLPARPTIHLDLATEAMLDRVDIYRNGWWVDTIVLSGRRQELSWTDPEPVAGADVSYFAKISRADHECAWTLPIWVNGSRGLTSVHCGS